MEFAETLLPTILACVGMIVTAVLAVQRIKSLTEILSERVSGLATLIGSKVDELGRDINCLSTTIQRQDERHRDLERRVSVIEGRFDKIDG
jgi:hypothetical protein